MSFIKKNRMQILLLSLSTLITIANLYIASLLAPVHERIGEVEHIARANQKILEDRRSEIETIDVILTEIKDIKYRLERIENKLDQ